MTDETPATDDGSVPMSRAAKRLLERRQQAPAAESESGPQPLQAYVPELHEQKPEGRSRPTPAAKPARKMFGEALRRSLDADLEDELAAAMGEVGDLAKLTTPVDSNPADGASPKQSLDRGSKATGRIIAVRGDDIFVDLGDTSEGVLSILQFSSTLPAAGDAIEVFIDRYDSDNGLFVLRLPGASQEADWSTVAKGMIVDAHVKGVNKGGLEVTVNGLRGFMPAGQVDIGRIEDLTKLVGSVLRSEVTEAKVTERNLVVSRKKVLEREREELAQKTRELIAVGKVFDGKVRKLMEFGAFVDIGGVDGLVHVSQISWQKVRHPSELLREGDTVKVQVVSYEPATGKLGLSLRQLMDNPWTKLAERIAAGTIVSGRVVRTTEFGAFVEIEPGIEGLIHISELSGRRIRRVTEIVKEGDSVEAKVLEVDPDRQRISLSLKGAAPDEETAPEVEAKPEVPLVPEGRRPKPSKTPLKGGTGNTSGPLFG
jgi:small subunit ribosomal protein S1